MEFRDTGPEKMFIISWPPPNKVARKCHMPNATDSLSRDGLAQTGPIIEFLDAILDSTLS